ncbi:hypothetical protein WICPIJ_007287 [Wickerhamomyces pijperi]|uniref:Uncharacterized protein n=1 Tax=Wickerhamomyces pijperi TaxID=599730 RepID=A0A9P8Q254_WICPI|nr:hypothetical protein WICPIJ_007287 [Wickerhamomyces pijperi]
MQCQCFRSDPFGSSRNNLVVFLLSCVYSPHSVEYDMMKRDPTKLEQLLLNMDEKVTFEAFGLDVTSANDVLRIKEG